MTNLERFAYLNHFITALEFIKKHVDSDPEMVKEYCDEVKELYGIIIKNT